VLSYTYWLSVFLEANECLSGREVALCSLAHQRSVSFEQESRTRLPRVQEDSSGECDTGWAYMSISVIVLKVRTAG
jgi:hypothetical protein